MPHTLTPLVLSELWEDRTGWVLGGRREMLYGQAQKLILCTVLGSLYVRLRARPRSPQATVKQGWGPRCPGSSAEPILLCHVCMLPVAPPTQHVRQEKGTADKLEELGCHPVSAVTSPWALQRDARLLLDTEISKRYLEDGGVGQILPDPPSLSSHVFMIQTQLSPGAHLASWPGNAADRIRDQRWVGVWWRRWER